MSTIDATSMLRIVWPTLLFFCMANAVVAEGPKRVEVDGDGDPLPRGAVARMGTKKLRPGDPYAPFSLSPDGKTVLTGEPGWLRLWDVESGKESRAIAAPDALEIREVHISQDGAHVAATALDRSKKDTVRLLVAEVKSGKLIHNLGETSVASLAFLNGGAVLATHEYSGDGPLLRLWDVVSGKELQTILEVESFATSADGRTLALTSAEGTIRLWDIPARRQLRTFKPCDGSVFGTALSSDGKLLAGVCWTRPPAEDRTIRIWATATGKELRRMPDYDEATAHLVFSPDSSTLLSGPAPNLPTIINSYDEDFDNITAMFWDTAAGTLRCCRRVQRLTNCAMSRDGKHIYECRFGALMKIQLDGGKTLRRWQLPPGTSSSFVIDHAEKSAVFGKGGLAVWDLAKEKMLHAGHGYRGAVENLLFSKDGGSLASLGRVYTDTSKGGSLRLWEVNSGRRLPRFIEDDSLLADYCIAPVKSTFTMITDDGKIRQWESGSGKLVREELLNETGKRFLSLSSVKVRPGSSSFDGSTLPLSAGDGPNSAVWGFGTQKAAVPPSAFDQRWKSFWSSDGRYMVLDGSDDMTLWDLGTGKQLARHAGRQHRPLVDFSADGSLMAWGGGKKLSVWDLKLRKEIQQFQVRNERILECAFDRDSRSLVIYVNDREADSFRLVKDETALLLDVRSGLQIECPPNVPVHKEHWDLLRMPGGRPLEFIGSEHRFRVFETISGRTIADVKRDLLPEKLFPCCLSPDGRLLACGGGSIDLIETASGGVLARLPPGHRWLVTALAFSADGRQLASGGSDTTIVVWDIEKACGLHTPRDKRNVQELWRDLASPDASIAYKSIAELSADPQPALRMLKEHLRPVRDEDLAAYRRRLADLEDRRFAVREQAFRELEKAPAEWEFVFRDALLARPSLELRRRLEAIRRAPALRKFSAETLQALRGVQLLERIGTKEAKQLLKELSGGLSAARLTQDATDALQRLANSAKGP